MREKVKELMGILLTPIDKTANDLVGAFKERFQEGFGDEVSSEALAGVALIDRAAVDRRDALEDAIATAFELHFAESDVDTLLAFYRSTAYAKLSQVSGEIQAATAEATSLWIKELMTSIEPELAKLLGGPEDGIADKTEPEAAPPTAA